jgi:O-antigen ligase
MTRVFAWAVGLDVFVRHPIIGVGFNTYGFVQAKLFGGELIRNSFGLDGGVLFIAVLTGLVGLAFYVAMVGAVLARCRRIWRDGARPAEERALGLGVGALTVGILVHSFFLNTLFYPFLMEPLWVLWALTLVVARHRSAAAPRARPAGGALQLAAGGG